MRFLIVGLVAILALIVACQTDDAETDASPTAEPSAPSASTGAPASSPEPTVDSDTASPAPSSTEQPIEDPALGDRVEVGSLDLTVLGIERIDTTPFNQFNNQNFRVFVLATNGRGDVSEEYNVSDFAFELVDMNGITYDAAFGCSGCPGAIDETYLPVGRSVLGYVYFEFPPDRVAVELIYEPLFSLNKARIDLGRVGNEGGVIAPSLVPVRLSNQPTVGDLVQVGDLDLTVLGHGPVDTTRYNQFNDANFSVRVEAVNARGEASEEYNLSAFFAFELIDSDGVHYDSSFGCAGCPEEIDDIDLIRGGRVEGLVYFEVRDEARIVELRYAPLFSLNVARIWIAD